MSRRPDYFRYAYTPDGRSDFVARLNEAPKTESNITPVSFSETKREITHLKNGLNAAIEEKTNTDFIVAERLAKVAAAEREMAKKEADTIAKANAETEISMRLAKIEADNLADPDGYKDAADGIKGEFSDFTPQFEAQFRQGYVRVFNQKTQAEREKIAADTRVSFEENSRRAALATRNGDILSAKKYNELAAGNIAYLEKTGLLTAEALRTMRQSLDDSIQLGGMQADLDVILNDRTQNEIVKMRKANEYTARVFTDDSIPTDKRHRFASALQKELNFYREGKIAGRADFDKRYKIYADAVTKGYPVDRRQGDELKELAVHLNDADALNKIVTAERVAGAVADFALLTPAQQKALIDNTVVDVDDGGFTSQMQATMRSINTETERLLKDDPQALAQKNAIVAPISAFTPEELKARAVQTMTAGARYVQKFPLFSKADADRFSDAMNAFENYNDKARFLAQSIAAVGEEYAPELVEAVAPNNPEIAHCSSVAEYDQKAAALILKGADVRRKNPEYLEASEKKIRDAIGGMLPDYIRKGSPDFERGLKDAVLDYAVGAAQQSGIKASDFDDDLLKTAVNMVTGGVVSYDAGLFHREYKTIVPVPGMTEDDYETAIDNLRAEDFKNARVGFRGSPAPVDVEAIKDDGVFEAVGRNQYMIALNGDYLKNPDGSPFVYSFPLYVLDAKMRKENPNIDGDIQIMDRSVVVVRSDGNKEVVGTFKTNQAAVQYANELQKSASTMVAAK